MRLGCAAVVGPLRLWQMCPGDQEHPREKLFGRYEEV